MDCSTKLKTVWWLLLLVAVTSMVWFRKSAVMNGEMTGADALLVAVWIILWMFPLVAEMSVLGVSVKKEVAKATAELKSDISDLKNTVLVQNSAQSNVYIGAPPSDESLDSPDFVKIFEEALESSDSASPALDVGVEDRTKTLLFLRYKLEREVNRVYELAFPESGARFFMQRIRSLHDGFLITDEVLKASAEIYRICSAAVHAQDFSDKQYKFATNLADYVLDELASAR